MTDLQTVITTLTRLSGKDLQTVKAAADQLMISASSMNEPANGEELELLYTQLAKVLADKGVQCPKWFVFKRLKLFKSYCQKFEEVENYSLDYFGNLTKRHRQRLYYIYAFTLINWIVSNTTMPLALQTVVYNVHNISVAMANAFPGYAESGLLPFLLKVNGNITNSED